MVIGVKFCGNCNPKIDSMAVLKKIAELLPDCHFVHWSQSKDVLLILAGCPVNCLELPQFDGPSVLVAGETLNLLYCPAENLANKAAHILKSMGNLKHCNGG